MSPFLGRLLILSKPGCQGTQIADANPLSLAVMRANRPQFFWLVVLIHLDASIDFRIPHFPLPRARLDVCFFDNSVNVLLNSGIH
jgi:hypothetical protein